MSAFSSLRRRFSNRPNVIQTRQGTERLPFKSFHPHWIVGRSLTMYRSEDFTNVPRNRRRAALDLKLPLWSPFARTGHHCVWEGGRAMIWFWDADVVAAEANPDTSADSGTPHRILPETVFLPRLSDGVCLQECHEGFELQHWKEGFLEHAYWFRQRPDQARIDGVLAEWGAAAAPLDPAAASDTGSTLQDATHEPWSSSLTPREWLEANERSVATAALLVFALAATWHEARYWQARHLQQAAEQDFAALQQDLDPILSARNELLALRSRNLAVAEILGEPSQAYLMGLVDSAIPSPEARFRQWSYQQRELTVVVEDESADPIAYVRSLEAEPMFEQVEAKQGRRDNEILMTLVVRP
ncbi:MAG: hypothetical protein OXQ84_17720 [bacterium]|nr:hypothetical protein [bacterium]